MKNRKGTFAENYSLYYPLIFSTILTKVDNIDDAQDICQEVFIIYYNKMDEVENPRKWLYGTMKNLILNHYRKKKGDHVDIDDVFTDAALTFVNGFRDLRIIVAEALEDEENFRDEEEKVLFDLIAIHNYTYEEAGKYIGITKNKARYRYNKIAEKILDYLSKRGINSLEELL